MHNLHPITRSLLKLSEKCTDNLEKFEKAAGAVIGLMLVVVVVIAVKNHMDAQRARYQEIAINYPEWNDR